MRDDVTIVHRSDSTGGVTVCRHTDGLADTFSDAHNTLTYTDLQLSATCVPPKFTVLQQRIERSEGTRTLTRTFGLNKHMLGLFWELIQTRLVHPPFACHNALVHTNDVA